MHLTFQPSLHGEGRDQLGPRRGLTYPHSPHPVGPGAELVAVKGSRMCQKHEDQESARLTHAEMGMNSSLGTWLWDKSLM